MGGGLGMGLRDMHVGKGEGGSVCKARVGAGLGAETRATGCGVVFSWAWVAGTGAVGGVP